MVKHELKMKKWSRFPLCIKTTIILIVIIAMIGIPFSILQFRNHHPAVKSAGSDISGSIDTALLANKSNADTGYTYDLNYSSLKDDTVRSYRYVLDKMPLESNDLKHIIYRNGNKKYLLKTWDTGSDAFLAVTIYSFIDPAHLKKIYSFPDSIDSYQGRLLLIHNQIYLVLASKRFKLTINDDSIALAPYPVRLKLSAMKSSEHILRFESNKGIGRIFFDDKPLSYATSGDSHKFDTIILHMADMFWIDDNSSEPASLRQIISSDKPVYQYNSGLFESIKAVKYGTFTMHCYFEASRSVYMLNFKIQKTVGAYL
jgi:hypothetical protein